MSYEQQSLPMARAQSLGAILPVEDTKSERTLEKAEERNGRAKARRAKAKKRRAKATKENRKTQFLSLPPELRNRIYEHTVATTHSKIVINSSGVIRNGVPPALLRTCRDIRNEGLPIYFRDKIFVFRICPPNGCHYVLDIRRGLANYDLKMIIGNDTGGYPQSTCCLKVEHVSEARLFLDTHIAKGNTQTMDEVLLRGLGRILLRGAWKIA